MENIERDDAFFGVVNKNKKTTDIVASAGKEIEKQEMFYARRIANAQSAQKKYEERIRKNKKNDAIKTFVVAGTILAALASGITIAAVHGEDIVNTNSGINIMTSNANRVLEAQMLSHGNSIQDNSIRDYKKLNVSSVEEAYIYIYESVLSKSKNEVDDFIKSVSYYDSEGNKCFYTDFNDFLVRNNFRDEDEFKDDARKCILEKYELEQIKHLPYEGIGTVNKGGR